MYFAQRWVPIEVMNTIFALWAITVLLIAATLFWFMHSGRPTKDSRDTPPDAIHKKRKVRKKR